MLVISVYCSKGGVGKSTVVSNLAVSAAMKGVAVGVLDLDPQGSLLSWRRSRRTGDVAVSSCALAELPRIVASERQRAKFGLILVDTPPGVSLVADAALAVSDVVLSPVRASAFDLHALSQTFARIRRHGKKFGVVINAAPPRRNGTEAPLVREARDALRAIGGRLWRGQITHRLSVVYAAAVGLGVGEFEREGPCHAEFEKLWLGIKDDTKDLKFAA